jgi:hypothetical protein
VEACPPGWKNDNHSPALRKFSARDQRSNRVIDSPASFHEETAVYESMDSHTGALAAAGAPRQFSGVKVVGHTEGRCQGASDGQPELRSRSQAHMLGSNAANEQTLGLHGVRRQRLNEAVRISQRTLGKRPVRRPIRSRLGSNFNARLLDHQPGPAEASQRHDLLAKQVGPSLCS